MGMSPNCQAYKNLVAQRIRKDREAVYGLDAGRVITQDGKPFLILKPCAATCAPAEADRMAREIVALLNERNETLKGVKALEEEVAGYKARARQSEEV